MTEKKNNAPAFQWYPKDILGSTRVAELTLEEEGAYRRALDFSWLNNGLPNDAAKICKIIGKECTIEIAKKVMQFFKKNRGKSDTIFSPRQQLERVKQIKNRVTNAKNGQKGAKKRWHNNLKNNKLNSEAIVSPMAKNSIAFAIANKENIIKEKIIEGTWDYEKNNFLQNEGWQYQFVANKNIQLEKLKTLMKDFVKNIELKTDYKPADELRNHFTNWYDKNLKDGLKTGSRQNGQISSAPPLKHL